jgi:hypothetical protein
MNTLRKAAMQGAACGLMIGVVLLVGGRVWHPATVADVMRARRFEMVDAHGEEQAILGPASDGSPNLSLWDAAGKARAVLGAISVPALKTTEQRKRAESSLVLFDKDERVIWVAP